MMDGIHEKIYYVSACTKGCVAYPRFQHSEEAGELTLGEVGREDWTDGMGCMTLVTSTIGESLNRSTSP